MKEGGGKEEMNDIVNKNSGHDNWLTQFGVEERYN